MKLLLAGGSEKSLLALMAAHRREWSYHSDLLHQLTIVATSQFSQRKLKLMFGSNYVKFMFCGKACFPTSPSTLPISNILFLVSDWLCLGMGMTKSKGHSETADRFDGCLGQERIGGHTACNTSGRGLQPAQTRCPSHRWENRDGAADGSYWDTYESDEEITDNSMRWLDTNWKSAEAGIISYLIRKPFCTCSVKCTLNVDQPARR